MSTHEKCGIPVERDAWNVPMGGAGRFCWACTGDGLTTATSVAAMEIALTETVFFMAVVLLVWVRFTDRTGVARERAA